MSKFTKQWNRSTQVRKQRKYRYHAPLHIQQKMMSAHLSPILRKKYGRRHVPVRVGDKVRIMRGTFSKKEGKVERANLKRGRVYVTGLDIIKKDGTKVLASFQPSKLMLLELDLADKKRKKKLESSPERSRQQPQDSVAKKGKAGHHLPQNQQNKDTEQNIKKNKEEN